MSTGPRARRRITMELGRPPEPALPPPSAAVSGPFSAAEVLDVVTEPPPRVWRAVALIAAIAGALGVGGYLWSGPGPDATIAATPTALPTR